MHFQHGCGFGYPVLLVLILTCSTHGVYFYHLANNSTRNTDLGVKLAFKLVALGCLNKNQIMNVILTLLLQMMRNMGGEDDLDNLDVDADGADDVRLNKCLFYFL